MAIENIRSYTDKYFLRMKQVLEQKDINPWVNMQVHVKKGPGIVAGIPEAIKIIAEHSEIEEFGGQIYYLPEDSQYEAEDTIMNIVAPVQSICELETVYLGVLSQIMTRVNDGHDLNFTAIGKQMREVASLVHARNRTVMYFGARHWSWTYDKALADLAFSNDIDDVATDNGASLVNDKGVGTVPHALEAVFAYYYGRSNAVKESTKAFDDIMPEHISRIALVDYNNAEIKDTLNTARALNGKLDGVRVDTCGENVQQGSSAPETEKFFDGYGVTSKGIYQLRQTLNDSHYPDVKIILSSGFSNADKISAFHKAEDEYYQMKLYDSIGAGFLDGVRSATADIVAVGETKEEVDFYQKKTKMTDKNIVPKTGRHLGFNMKLESVF